MCKSKLLDSIVSGRYKTLTKADIVKRNVKQGVVKINTFTRLKNGQPWELPTSTTFDEVELYLKHFLEKISALEKHCSRLFDENKLLKEQVKELQEFTDIYEEDHPADDRPTG